MRMTYTVTVDGLRKSYGPHVVIDDLNLRVESGTVYALLGPNGAGKTTVINILSTLVKPDRGEVVVAGHDLRTDPIGVRRSISLTGQFVALDGVLTTNENLTMMARLHRLSPKAAQARADELIAEYELEEVRNVRVKTCSGGMRRRVDLAISLIHRPPLVFLDEPTTGLDPRSREQVWASIRKLVGSGSTVLLTTQYLEEADRLADKIVMLHGGRVVAEGTADELKSSLSGEVVRLEFLDVTTSRRAADSLGQLTIGVNDGRPLVEVATDGTADAIRVLLSRLEREGTPAHRLTVRRPSLDDVFLSLTGAGPTTMPAGAP
jgi:ABC-2 type transport system ATP-binding protein